jgi:hypothetical protein
MSIEIKKLNAYPDFRTDEGIRTVMRYVNNHNNLPNLPPRQLNRFIQKFNDDWIVEGTHLYYSPTTNGEVVNRIKLLVVPPNDRDEILAELYDDETKGLSLGLNAFYNQVSINYLNINQNYCNDWLRRNGNYQVTRPTKTTTNVPIYTSTLNKRWGIDLIHMTDYPNGKYKYILTVVDYFSKKFFAKPLTNTKAITVANAFDRIMTDNDTVPKIIQCDNGPEFGKEFKELIDNVNDQLEDYKCEIVHSLSHNPKSNGLIERYNRSLRTRIRAGFAKHNDHLWTEHLDNYVENINNQRQSTKFTANQIWKPHYEPPNHNDYQDVNINDHSNKEDIIKHHRNSKAKYNAQRRDVEGRQFNVGDRVRVLLTSIYPEYRQRDKNGMEKKKNAIKYSPEIYTIYKRYNFTNQNLPPNHPLFLINQLKHRKYSIEDDDGDMIIRGNEPIRFFENELLLVPNNSTEPTITTNQRAKVINKI